MEAIQDISSPAGESSSRNEEPSDDAKRAAEIDHALADQINPADTVVVSGFWRSGTTWLEEALAEILQAKTIFEPFHFLVPAAKQLFKYCGVAKKSESFRELFIPYCGERTLEMNPLLHHYYDCALRAGLAGKAVRVLRKNPSESHRTRVVVKFTRGQFTLRAGHNTFAMPIIHVYRDPRAVVASAKMTDWYWLFDHLNLKEQLLDIPDGRAACFSQWQKEIGEYDRDKVSKIAAYWAITEKFLQDGFANSGSRIVFVSYEKLCREPEFIQHILGRLNVQKPWNGNFQTMNGDSFSTSEQRRGASSAERISGWRKALSSAETATIESIARHFGFEERLANG